MHNRKEHSHNVQDEDSTESKSEMSKYDCKNCSAKFKDIDEPQRHTDKNHGTKISKKQKNNKK